jgi:small subunit ribosomal protein S5
VRRQFEENKLSGEQATKDLPEKVVQIRRCACVVKGGRRFSFTALVVVGDGKGRVGYGYGKGAEVPQAVEKAVKSAGRNMITVPVNNGTVPHMTTGKFGSSRVMITPANPGTGIIAGACIRAVAESVGLRDVLTKCRGSNNPLNVVKAAFEAIRKIRQREDVVRLRGGAK